jgi:hypothetical protein
VVFLGKTLTPNLNTMNCFNHTNDTAVAQCQDCQKGLCTTCSKQYALPICKYCNDYRISHEKKDIYLELFYSYGIGLILVYLFSKFTKTDITIPLYFGYFYICSGIYPGWKLINKFFPTIIFGNIVFSLFILLFKLSISIYVGLVALPFRTFKMISRLYELNKIE